VADPFISEIKMVSFGFAPRSWALCNGQQLPINQNQALFSLLGTTFGGNGQTTFALPDLRGRVPMHEGSGHTLGERGGEEGHTITPAELPQHVHVLTASTTPGDLPVPTGRYLAPITGANVYSATASPAVPLSAASLTPTGGSQAHLNLQPFLTLNFVIALVGIFPSQN
jgi:microcystin-dependent protein